MQPVYAQVVNAYAKVTNITGNTLTLSNVDESAHTFEDGEYIIILHLQDDVIGTTTNTATFGDVGSIESAGRYEIRQIDSHTENLGIPLTITVDAAFTNTYNTGANSSLQIITFRKFGTPDYVTTSEMDAMPWNGDVGGVLAIDVDGVFQIDHWLAADAYGFRGGSRSNNKSGPICISANSTRYIEDNADLGFKGEGIYKNNTDLYNNGRGRITNGGGGGSDHNGGGNFGAGGVGGNGWNNCTTFPAGGLGGANLSSFISGTRIFMGGGGGGGQQNNSQSRNGGAGGGIIIIRAAEITTVTCPSIRISADGVGPVNSGTNDGGGGGGAGGSIVFFVDTWSVAAACPVSISANGGNGSSSLSGGSHGGGGGGGQGVVIFNDTEPVVNITTETENGTAGCGNTSSPCNSPAGVSPDIENTGIIASTPSTLPVELVSFTAYPEDENIRLDWETKSERNNDFFTVERSTNGLDWKSISIVKGNGNSNSSILYSDWDFNPLKGVSYYRLKQTDFNGDAEYSQVVSVRFNIEKTLVYPNPAKNQINFSKKNIAGSTVQLIDLVGRMVQVETTVLDHNLIQIPVDNLPEGVYIAIITDKNGEIESHRFTIIQ